MLAATSCPQASPPSLRAQASFFSSLASSASLISFSFPFIFSDGAFPEPPVARMGRAPCPQARHLAFLTVGRGKPPASPAHFTTHRMSCPAFSSCAGCTAWLLEPSSFAVLGHRKCVLFP